MGTKDSNEAKLVSIRRALVIGTGLRGGKLVVEGDSTNAIKWAMGLKRRPWRLIATVREIRAQVLGVEVSFVHISRTTNGVANFFTKNEVGGSITGVFQLPGG